MSTSSSQQNLIDSESCSQLELDHDRMSFAKLYSGLTKIKNLTYRLAYLSSFVSVIQETLEFSSTFSFIFRYCSKEIVGLAETARKTLESAGVVPYLWASCPETLLPHKRVYIQLLRLLHSNERDISPPLRRRLRALLMPLTSQFSITKKRDLWQPPYRPRKTSHSGIVRAETPTYRTTRTTVHEAGRDECMPPPPAPPLFRTPIFRRRSNGGRALTCSIKGRLWTEDELLPPLSHGRRHRVRRSRADSDDDDENDQRENSAPEENVDVVPFRQPRAKLRFGICFNGKSSSQQNGGRMNYKE